MAKELIPIVMMAAVWGKNWQVRTVLAKCDKATVVAINNSGTSNEKEAMTREDVAHSSIRCCLSTIKGVTFTI